MKTLDKDESSEDNEEYSEDISFDDDNIIINQNREKEIHIKPEFFMEKYKYTGTSKNDRLFQSIEESCNVYTILT